MTLDGEKTKNDHLNTPQAGGGQHKPMGIQLIVCIVFSARLYPFTSGSIFNFLNPLQTLSVYLQNLARTDWLTFENEKGDPEGSPFQISRKATAEAFPLVSRKAAAAAF